MSIPKGTQFGFRFRELEEFEELIAERKLEPGCFYFVGKMFHIAFTEDTYRTYSNGMTVQEIINKILEDNLIKAGVKEVTNQIINDLQTLITNEFVEQIVNDVTNQSILQIVNSIQHATNEQYGIVKGADNNSAATWNRVSIDANGIMSVNKELLEAKIGQGGGGTGGSSTWDLMLAKPDRSIIAETENRNLVVQQTLPTQYGVVKCHRDCICYPKPLSLQSIDGLLVAVLKHNVYLFFPMMFPEKLPPRFDLLDKLTFIAPNSGGGGSGHTTAKADYTQSFTIDVHETALPPDPFDPANYTQDFTIEVDDPTAYKKTFSINVTGTGDFSEKLEYVRGAKVPATNHGFAKGVFMQTSNPATNGKVLFCPSSSSKLGWYTPPSGEINSANQGTFELGVKHGGTAEYNYGGCASLPDGRVVLAPYDTARVRIVNIDGTVSDGCKHGVSGTYPCAFTGCCYVEATGGNPARVIFTPYTSSKVRGYYPGSNTMFNPGISHGHGSAAFGGDGIRLRDGRILFVPCNSKKIGLFDPKTNVYSDGAAHGQGDNAFGGGVHLPDGKVLLVPRNSKNIGLYNPVTGIYTNSAVHGCGKQAFYSGILLEEYGKVVLIPYHSKKIGIYDIAAGTYSDGLAHGESLGNSGSYYFCGAIHLKAKKTIVMIPRASNHIGFLKISDIV
jgi:hypothetical protein